MWFTTKSILTHSQSTNFPWKILVLILVLGCGVYLSKDMIATRATQALKQTAQFGTKAVSSRWGTMQRDDQWFINAMLVWVWWKWHRGAYNADTIIVVRYHPETKKTIMLSIPRDLYVKQGTWTYGRINSMIEMYWIATWLDILKLKVKEIVWVDIPYYAMIDFKWFESMIDTLGWIQVDVTKKLVDTTFPIDEFNYGTLIINSWSQIMDGQTALNYARSRHSTSDFDRSQRQQIIIHAIAKKLLWNWIANIQELYDQFQRTVTTNVTMADMLWSVRYISDIWSIQNHTFKSDCIESLATIQAWCLLYSPPRDDFGGASVLIPLGASSNAVSNYAKTRLFASILTQDITQPITILNGISKRWSWKATQLWIELIRYGYTINDVTNTTWTTWTTIFYATWDAPLSLWLFVTWAQFSQDISSVSWYVASWAQIIILLWNSYGTYK